MSQHFLDVVASQIASARKSAGMTQIDLANRIGVDQSHISRLERAQKGSSVELLVQIAHELDVPVARLFGEAEVAPKATDEAPAIEALHVIESWIALPQEQRLLVKSMLNALKASSRVDEDS